MHAPAPAGLQRVPARLQRSAERRVDAARPAGAPRSPADCQAAAASPAPRPRQQQHRPQRPAPDRPAATGLAAVAGDGGA
ncbi:MAG: 2-oxoglutarate dehydrogenase, E2 component, dihydrolipoamide succinyltransferase, partial [Betaproteobacteria bacterium]|nr:2-oxoglutarate dehydrogenase, E2 component, dihydrolipoamide succinyltransferase [Betaproteobacteria bacterium]